VNFSAIASHLVLAGTHALDIGAMTVFFYCFREREEDSQPPIEAASAELTPSYFRIGGLMMTCLGFERRTPAISGWLLKSVDEFLRCLTGTEFFRAHAGSA